MAYVIDSATPALNEILRTLRDRSAVNNVIATAGTQVVQKHFVKMAMSNRNKFGRPATFWKRMRGATRAESSMTEAAIVMPNEVAQRYFGGPIKPTGGRKMLTIPISRISYGKSALEFEDLFVLKIGKDGGDSKTSNKAYLARNTAKGLELLYVLKSSVIQQGNPDVLPRLDEIQEAVTAAISTYIQRRTR